MILFPILLIAFASPLYFYLYISVHRLCVEFGLTEEQEKLLLAKIRYIVWTAQAVASGIVLLIGFIKPYFLGR